MKQRTTEEIKARLQNYLANIKKIHNDRGSTAIHQAILELSWVLGEENNTL